MYISDLSEDDIEIAIKVWITFYTKHKKNMGGIESSVGSIFLFFLEKTASGPCCTHGRNISVNCFARYW